MRVLVTGGAGFIGSHVVDALADAGHEPVIFDQVPSVHHDPAEVRHVAGDITDLAAARRAARGCDAVIHLAAVADVNDVVADPMRADRVNVHGTLVVLDAARHEDVPRVVYGSTVWVYGDAPGDGVLDENSPLTRPTHLYTATKLAGEMYTIAYGELHGADNCVLRFGIPYGPRARPAAVIPSFVSRAERGEALTIAGEGRQTRQFVYVEDLAIGIVAGLARGRRGREYNLVGDEETSVREIADAVRELVTPVPIVHGPERPADVRLRRVSSQRAASELGWQASVRFADGLSRYTDWLGRQKGSGDASSTRGSAAAVLRQESAEL